jgi:hypothetical protein
MFSDKSWTASYYRKLGLLHIDNVTARPTAKFTGPFRFFDLAHELRDEVFHYTWVPTRLHKESKDIYGASQLTVTASYGYGLDMSEEDRVTASKAFHREAMQQFFSDLLMALLCFFSPLLFSVCRDMTCSGPVRVPNRLLLPT